jgi:hypothetical protein
MVCGVSRSGELSVKSKDENRKEMGMILFHENNKK